MFRDSENIGDYESHVGRKRLVVIVLVLSTIIMAIVSLTIGSTNMSISEVIDGLFGTGTLSSSVKIWEHRMPRVLAAVIAGAGLGVAGCVMQNNLKNPLADPSTLGISSAAVFGANLAIIVFGAGASSGHKTADFIINNPYAVTLMAFIMAMITTMLILVLSKKRDFSPAAVVLAGVAIGSIFAAGTTILQYFSTDTALATAIFWSFGDLSKINWNELGIIAVVVSISSVFFYMMRWNYNALANGDELAKSLGVNVDKLIWVGLMLTCLIAAVSVSFLGMISFIGLIAPQIMRRIVGDDHRFLIPASIAAGALILLVSDAVARTIMSPMILPVGAITSLLGGPMFLYILSRKGDKRW